MRMIYDLDVEFSTDEDASESEYSGECRCKPSTLADWLLFPSDWRNEVEEVSTDSQDEHVPEINQQIPSIDQESTSHHQRLSDRLQQYHLVELKISGDGNCQFRSLSDQIYGTQERHQHVREQVVNQLKLRSDLYKDFVPMDYDHYMEKMSKNGEWGDHVTLQAAADWFGIEVFIITSFKDKCSYEILPQTGHKSDKVIYLSFWADMMHYNSLYRSGKLPSLERKKRRRRNKKNKNWRPSISEVCY